MKVTVKERVFDVLHTATEPLSTKQVMALMVGKASSSAISNAILTLHRIKNCNIETFKQGNYDFHFMESSITYSDITHLGNPEIIIRIMMGNQRYLTMKELYDLAVKMGCRTSLAKFSQSMYTVGQYNKCKITTFKSTHGNTKYKMMSEPVRPFVKNEKKKLKVEHDYSNHNRSAVNLLFDKMPMEAVNQNKRMEADQRG